MGDSRVKRWYCSRCLVEGNGDLVPSTVFLCTGCVLGPTRERHLTRTAARLSGSTFTQGERSVPTILNDNNTDQQGAEQTSCEVSRPFDWANAGGFFLEAICCT
jgi:hypothetical protein